MSLENNSVTIILSFLSIVTLITGFWFYFSPPKKINMFYGYRTKNSIKSQKHWDFAHIYSGRLFLIYGLVLLILAFVVNFFNFNNTIGNFIAIAIFIVGVLIIIMKTERTINKKFNFK